MLIGAVNEGEKPDISIDDGSDDGVDERVAMLSDEKPPLCRSIAQWCGALGLAFLLSMEAMGYQALLPALYKSGQFQWVCPGPTVEPTSLGAACPEQQARLDLMFTCGYAGLNLAAFPVGILLHRYPPKYIACGAFLVKSVAYALLAAGTDGAGAWLGDDRYQDLAIPAYALVASLGLSACLPFLSLPPLLFGAAAAGLANSSLMGAADASTLGYYLVREVYLHSSIPLRTLFMGYAVLALLGSACGYLVLGPVPSSADQARKATGEVLPVVPRLFSAKFGVILFWHCCFFASKYFYMTNVTAEVRWLSGSDDEAYSLNTVFSIIMPATGILTPVVGWLLSKGMRVSILVNTLLAAVLMVASCVYWTPLQYAMLFCIAASRFMVFSIIPTLCGLPETFGFEGGVFFSIASGVAGLLSAANYGLSAVCRHYDTYLVVNLCLGSLCMVATGVLLAYLGHIGIR
ncbi:hypothetical protein DIPPA_21331 [Diplonema papillatum]|nr:hypothetical protein DIPPA_21331 [Diplonema papillatum]